MTDHYEVAARVDTALKSDKFAAAELFVAAVDDDSPVMGIAAARTESGEVFEFLPQDKQ